MSDKLTTKDGKVLTGQIRAKDKIVLTLAGKLLIWLGKKLQKIETYEQLDETGKECEKRLKQIEKDHPDNPMIEAIREE